MLPESDPGFGLVNGAIQGVSMDLVPAWRGQGVETRLPLALIADAHGKGPDGRLPDHAPATVQSRSRAPVTGLRDLALCGTQVFLDSASASGAGQPGGHARGSGRPQVGAAGVSSCGKRQHQRKTGTKRH